MATVGGPLSTGDLQAREKAAWQRYGDTCWDVNATEKDRAAAFQEAMVATTAASNREKTECSTG